MTRFLGDSPFRVLVKLVLLSLVAGWVMNWLHLTPLGLLDQAVAVAGDLWRAGFAGLERFGGTIALGAVVVVPLFLVSRLAAVRRG